MHMPLEEKKSIYQIVRVWILIYPFIIIVVVVVIILFVINYFYLFIIIIIIQTRLTDDLWKNCENKK